MSKLDDLMAGLTDAVARAPKRRPKRSRSGELTPAAQAVLFRAAEHKHAAARVELDGRAERERARYLRQVARLATIGARVTAVRKALEAEAWGSERCARLLTYAMLLRAQRAAIFDLPVDASDLADGGRFYRRAVWLGLEVGMLAVDEVDVVAGAVELCYIKGQTAEDWKGRMMPKLGAMYRNLKLYYHGQLDRFRRNKSAGVVAVHSLEALTERMGDAWLDDNAQILGALGFGFASRADIDAMYPPVMLTPEQLPASRAAIEWEANQKRRMTNRAQREAAVRDTLAEGAVTPAGYDAASFNADRMAIRAIVNGATLVQVAELCNVSVATLSGRLLALEGQLGATVYSGPGSVPVAASVEGVAAQAYPKPEVRPTPRHKRESGWTAKRNGALAGPVMVTNRGATRAARMATTSQRGGAVTPESEAAAQAAYAEVRAAGGSDGAAKHVAYEAAAQHV